VWSHRETPPPSALSPYVYDILRQRAQGRHLFNGSLVRQDEELSTDVLEEDRSISLSTTRYFSLLLTNYMMATGIRQSDSRRWIQRPEDLVDDGRNRLRPLTNSDLANPIGVSTLAFTTDRKVVLVLQSHDAQSAAGELAPSGSGSLDLRDVRRGIRFRTREELVTVIKRGMDRELREECHLRPDEIAWTYVLGYFRWMNKGAKPEYVGVTRLNTSSRELAHRPVSFSERAYVVDLIPDAVLDLAALGRKPEDTAALTVPDLTVRPSMPLFMCMRALGTALSRPDDIGQRLRRLSE
jgi:hypothetical protein